MTRDRLSQGIRKFIRLEKARIRRTVIGLEEQERMIKEFCSKFFLKEK